MIDSRLHPASRRLAWWFAATTLLLTAVLAWLGWTIVGLDRDQERQRRQGQREQAADVAVAALARTLAELEERLSGWSASPSAPLGEIGTRAAFMTFDTTGVAGRAGVALPYYPAVATGDDSGHTTFARADALEFVKRDPAGTIRELEPLARSTDPAVRAEALLRLARNVRSAGDAERALDSFQQLAAMGEVRLQNMPAGLLGRLGRALIFASARREADLRREASQLSADLQAGRWALTAAQYENAARQAEGWLGGGRPSAIDPDQAALAAAADVAWQAWEESGGRGHDGRSRRAEWTGDRSVLVLTRETPSQLAVLAIGAVAVGEAWSANLPAATRASSIMLALTDGDRHVIVGHLDNPTSDQAVRVASATQLPWTVHAVGGVGPATLSGRSQLMLAAIAVMVLLVMVSGYFVSRAVTREMRVARLQSDFVAAVSHEFRTPLTTIRQLSELLVRDRVSTDDKRRQFLDTILAESERLGRLVAGLLDFGRMEAGRFEYRFAPVDLPALLTEVVAGVEREAASTGHHIELDAPATAPAVAGDRDALAHVFRNLLDNAVKYSPEQRTVWVNLSNGDGRVVVRVRDRGLGIPAEEQREIFQKFVRGAASTAARIKGTGIGLALAREIVEAHGGTIAVESATGEGSTFTVQLPAL